MPTKDSAAELAAAMLRFRRNRTETLSADLFEEPAWDLLLELFVADAEGRSLTGRDAARRGSVRPTVMSRWLMHLDRMGMIVGDGSGDLDDELTLSATALDRMEAAMGHAQTLKSMVG